MRFSLFCLQRFFEQLKLLEFTNIVSALINIRYPLRYYLVNIRLFALESTNPNTQ